MPAPKPIRPEPPKTPVTEQAGRLAVQNLGLVDFLRWLDARGRLRHLTPWNPEDVVAEFQGIDMDALAAERRAVQDYVVAMHRYWDDVDAWRQAGGQ